MGSSAESDIRSELPVFQVVARLEPWQRKVRYLVLDVSFPPQDLPPNLVGVGHELLAWNRRGMIACSALEHFPAQPTFLIDFEQIKGNVLRLELEHGFQVALPRLEGLVRQTGHQINADVFEAHGTRAPHQLACVCGRMQPRHCAKFLVLKRLRSNAQAIHTHAHGLSQELEIGRAWSNFNCEFARGLDRKTSVKGADDSPESLHTQQ